MRNDGTFRFQLHVSVFHGCSCSRKKTIYFWYKVSFSFPSHLSISWDYRETPKWKLQQDIINLYWHFGNDSLSIPLFEKKKMRLVKTDLTKKIIFICLVFSEPPVSKLCTISWWRRKPADIPSGFLFSRLLFITNEAWCVKNTEFLWWLLRNALVVFAKHIIKSLEWMLIRLAVSTDYLCG